MPELQLRQHDGGYGELPPHQGAGHVRDDRALRCLWDFCMFPIQKIAHTLPSRNLTKTWDSDSAKHILQALDRFTTPCGAEVVLGNYLIGAREIYNNLVQSNGDEHFLNLLKELNTRASLPKEVEKWHNFNFEIMCSKIMPPVQRPFRWTGSSKF